MRLRLFWKIFILFWLTFMIIIEGVWVAFALYGSAHKPLDVRVAEISARQQMATAQAVLARDGIASLRAVMAAWPREQQGWLSVWPSQAPAPALAQLRGPHPLPPLEATVTAPDGIAYHLRFDTSDLQAQFRPPGPLNIPTHLVIVGLLGGLLFSAVLAWYLTQPIRRLRDGFSELAQGRLGVRLQAQMGRRRDELADLAQDFDAMAERLQQLIASRERMLHVVSHELRSPLARIHLAMGLARQDPRRVESTLERIELESQRLDRMVGEVLTLARAESGSQPLDDYFDLASLARAVGDDARFEAQGTGVRVETNLEPGPTEEQPTVRGNAELLRRALENVLRNALQYSAPGQTVRLEVSPDQAARQFVINILDQGPGMEDPKALKSMFDPFVRGRGPVSGQGFGLGLSIAHKAVLAHGGSIQALNRPEGGLAVTIRLPFGPLGGA